MKIFQFGTGVTLISRQFINEVFCFGGNLKYISLGETEKGNYTQFYVLFEYHNEYISSSNLFFAAGLGFINSSYSFERKTKVDSETDFAITFFFGQKTTITDNIYFAFNFDYQLIANADKKGLLGLNIGLFYRIE